MRTPFQATFSVQAKFSSHVEILHILFSQKYASQHSYRSILFSAVKGVWQMIQKKEQGKSTKFTILKWFTFCTLI